MSNGGPLLVTLVAIVSFSVGTVTEAWLLQDDLRDAYRHGQQDPVESLRTPLLSELDHVDVICEASMCE